MRLFFDMPLSVRSAEASRCAGHDAVHAGERGLHRAPDERLFYIALEERRVLVTMDLGFGRILSLAGEKGPSVILFRLDAPTPESVDARLSVVLKDFERELLAGAIVVVKERGTRIRMLPFTPER